MFTFTLTLTGGLCLFVIDFISDLESNLNDLSENLTIAARKTPLTSEQQNEIRRKLHSIIQFHSEARELRVNQFQINISILILFFVMPVGL